MEVYRAQIRNTKYGDLSAYVRAVDKGYVAFLDGTEYPDVPVKQASSGDLAMTVEEAVEHLRQAMALNNITVGDVTVTDVVDVDVTGNALVVIVNDVIL